MQTVASVTASQLSVHSLSSLMSRLQWAGRCERHSSGSLKVSDEKCRYSDGVRHQTAKALSFQNIVLKLKLGLTPLTPKTKHSQHGYNHHLNSIPYTLPTEVRHCYVDSKTGSLYRKCKTSSMAQNNVHLFIHHQWCNTAANMPLHTWHEIQHEH